MSSYLDLYDYRCAVIALYRERKEKLAAGTDPAQVFQHYCATRNLLFARHPQTALTQEQLQAFVSLNYFPYDPALCVVAELDTSTAGVCREGVMDAAQTMNMITVGSLHFGVGSQQVSLALYWLDIYGGGLFLPFRDATNSHETYGGGRYLFDTIKGSDFLTVPGTDGKERVILDFNYAYNPSCAYNSAFVCPLSPPENKLPVAIRAGEKKYIDDEPMAQ